MCILTNSDTTNHNRSCAELDPVADDRAGASAPGDTDRHIVPEQHVAPEHRAVMNHQSNAVIQP